MGVEEKRIDNFDEGTLGNHVSIYMKQEEEQKGSRSPQSSR